MTARIHTHTQAFYGPFTRTTRKWTRSMKSWSSRKKIS